jgi:hypothetical protein
MSKHNGNRIEQAFVANANRPLALPAGLASQPSAEQIAAQEAHARKMFSMDLARQCMAAMSASAQPPQAVAKRAFACADAFMAEFEERNKPTEAPPAIATE